MKPGSIRHSRVSWMKHCSWMKTAASLRPARLLRAQSEIAAKVLHGSDYPDKLYPCCVSELMCSYWRVGSAAPEPSPCYVVSRWPYKRPGLCCVYELPQRLAVQIVLSAPGAVVSEAGAPPLLLLALVLLGSLGVLPPLTTRQLSWVQTSQRAVRLQEAHEDRWKASLYIQLCLFNHCILAYLLKYSRAVFVLDLSISILCYFLLHSNNLTVLVTFKGRILHPGYQNNLLIKPVVSNLLHSQTHQAPPPPSELLTWIHLHDPRLEAKSKNFILSYKTACKVAQTSSTCSSNMPYTHDMNPYIIIIHESQGPNLHFSALTTFLLVSALSWAVFKHDFYL